MTDLTSTTDRSIDLAIWGAWKHRVPLWLRVWVWLFGLPLV